MKKQRLAQLVAALLLPLGCGGQSAEAPPPESADAREPEPVTVVQDEDDVAPSESPDAEAAAGAESTTATAESPPTTEGAPEADAPAAAAEEPLPSDDLQSYVGAATGYTPEYRTVMDNMDTFKQCYLDAMRADPDLSGVLKVRFTVIKTGKVTKAKATVNELNDRVADCVIKALKKLPFPKRAGKRTVEYPFQFIPSPG